MKQVEFYFDVGSPYSYLAYHQLQKIARDKGALILWRPMLLGGVFQATGNHSPAQIPLKSEHLNVDLARWARHFGVPFAQNPFFPINTLQLMRGATGLQMRDESAFGRYLAEVFDAMFHQPRDLQQPEEVVRVLKKAEIDPEMFMALIQDPEVKDELKRATQQAVARGVFGAPTFFVGDEMFWGQDRLQFVEQALS